MGRGARLGQGSVPSKVGLDKVGNLGPDLIREDVEDVRLAGALLFRARGT